MYKEPDVLRVFEGDQSAALFFLPSQSIDKCCIIWYKLGYLKKFV